MSDRMGGQQSTDTDTGSTPTSTSATVEAAGDEFKLLVIGDCGVGKSSLLTRFAGDTFTETYTTTTGVESVMRDVVLDGETIKLKIWDAAAQERFRTVTAAFYRGSHGIMVIYDVTKQESFNNVKDWLQKIDDHLTKDATRILVGNRCDETTNKVVDYTTAKEFADLRGIPFLETSAKDGTNVEQAFMTLVAAVKERIRTSRQ